jgi:hypothetical protein
MRETRMVARNRTLLKTLLAGAVVFWGCADLAMEAERIPTEMVIAPYQDRITQGEPTKLQVIVADQDGSTMRIPSWVQTVWTVSDGSVAEVRPDGMLNPTKSGRVDVSARVANLTADASYCIGIDPDQPRLSVPLAYVTQAAQGPDNAVRLIAGRPALLRIFLVAHPAGDVAPEVQVTLLQGEDVVFEHLFASDRQLASEVDESDLNGSFNVEIPGSALQPGVGMVVELDPNCKVALSPASDIRSPQTGSKELRVVEPQLFRQVFVPTLWRQQPDNRLWDWLDGINPGSEEMRYSRNLLPVSEMEVEVRDTFRTNANLNVFAGWNRWINEIQVLNISEGRRAYYYGVIGSSPTGLLGLGSFNDPWSVGVAEASTYTHEIGHNMDLRHAPCGGAGGPDPNYPHNQGSIGIWGYDFENKVLIDPGDYKDIMSYCDPVWISDYFFRLATTHRLHGDAGVNLDGGSNSSDRGEMLVVWGSVLDGELKLDPAFVLEGPVELPRTDGPYRVEGLGGGGETMFSLSFTPAPLDHGGNSFVFFVPYEPEWAATLDRMVLTGPEGEYTVTRDGEPAMAVLTDPSTGLIQAIIRDWDGSPIPGEESADVTVTRGIPAGGLR